MQSGASVGGGGEELPVQGGGWAPVEEDVLDEQV